MIRSLFKPSNCNSIKGVIHEGQSVSDLNGIVNVFNNHFVNIGPSLAVSIIPEDAIVSNVRSNDSNLLLLSSTNEDEVITIIKDPKDWAAGLDGIKAYVEIYC